jgi:predicted nucleotidyltransferase
MKDAKLVILFGSQASEKASENSDSDIAVLYDHPLSLEEKIELKERLSLELNISEEKIDLIDLWLAPPLLQYQIAQNGRLINGEISDFIRFKVLAWKRYQNTAKFRRIREKVLNKTYAK